MRERSGDFSQSKTSTGAALQIYDPLSTRSNGSGGYIRDPFSGSVIPASRISPIGAAVASAFPGPQTAAAFHGFWAKGNQDVALRFVNADDSMLTSARLALVGAVRQVLVNGLTLLGVSAPEELS